MQLPGIWAPPGVLLESGDHDNVRGLHCSPGPMVTSEPKLLLLAMSGSLVLMQLGSVLLSVVHVTKRGHENHVMNHVLKYQCRAEWAAPITGLRRVTSAPEN